MKYRESQIDKELRQWFNNDFSKALLRKITLIEGQLRGINLLNIELTYPITAFAGVNGAGKSTILAMACCAYHAKLDGYKLPKRKNSYYTFSDFFIQHAQEVSPQGIEIHYHIAHDKWKKIDTLPEGRGLAHQVRKKKMGGKWNDYDNRVKKCVVFLGIDRIVPHSERSQSRSYSKSFSNVTLKGWEIKVKETVGYILGKKYDDFRYLEHSKYSLPLVKCGDVTYSGFNMGAGENALFEIFSTIYSCGQNSLLVLEEIELGLHSKAQRLFIRKLKEVCKETGTQVICTTHSKEIFECLPDDARFFVESIGGKTRTTAGISPNFAFSKMGAEDHQELDIYVEDAVAKSLIEAILPAVKRTRVRIIIIGSASAISRQLASLWIRGEDRPVVAIFDGDQRTKRIQNMTHAKNMAEQSSVDFENWFDSHSAYLPGSTWPEAWIIQKCKDALPETAASLSLDDEGVASEYLEYALQAGKHNEFFEISKNVGLEKNHCLKLLTNIVATKYYDEFSEVRESINSKL